MTDDLAQYARALVGARILELTVTPKRMPASANPSKANRRLRAFLLPRAGLRRLMITALALSATAIGHHGLTDNQNDRTRRRFKLAKALPRPGGS